MKAEIIAVGSEIMLGDINNTHAKYISEKLAALGIDVCYHTAVGDNEARLTGVFGEALMRSDIIITTGGLGPTADDLTKEVISKTLGLQLVRDDTVLNEIKAFFARVGRDMPECNEKQALVPQGAEIVRNLRGTAPGLILESQGKERIIIMLPGPPSELIPMFDNDIYNYLAGLTDEVIISENLSVIGIGESRVEDMTSELLQSVNPSAALYAGTGQVRIRLTAKAQSEREAKKMLAPLKESFKTKLGDTIYSDCGKSLEQTVVELLREKNLKFAAAESCTGGLVCEKLTGVPGASEVFEFGIASYSNRIKSSFLNVSEKTLYLYGAVSGRTAIEMAAGALQKSGADIAAAITGFAGPGGGNAQNPVGTVYIAVAYGDKIWLNRITAGHGRTNERALIRETAALTALDMVRHILIGSPKAQLYLTDINDAVEGCADPVVKDGEYTPKWLKAAKAVFPWKGDPISETVRKSVILAAAAVFIICAVFVGVYVTQKVAADSMVNKTQSLYMNEPTQEQIYKLPYGYLDKFAGLYSANDEVKGWISIPDSKMEFPVVQADNNDYYLEHDFYKNYNSNGVPFLDYRTEISDAKNLDDNTLIYAHNIHGGRFFAELCNYKELEYYKERPVITFDSVYDEMQWKIVACFITNADPKGDGGERFMFNNYLNFNSPAKFNWYMEEINRRSIIDTGVDVKYGDKLLTLSTCTYEFDNARFVLVARKLRIGENADVNVYAAKYNKNPLYPQAYYDKHGGKKPELSDNPEPLTADQIDDSDGEAKPFYEFLSSYDANDYSFPEPDKNTYKISSSFTSSSYLDRPYITSSKSKIKTVSSRYGKTGTKKTSSKKTSSKKTPSSKPASSQADKTGSDNTASKDVAAE